MAPGQDEDSSQKEGAGAGPPSFLAFQDLGEGGSRGGSRCWNGSKKRGKDIARKCNRVYSGAACVGVHFLGKRTELEIKSLQFQP